MEPIPAMRKEDEVFDFKIYLQDLLLILESQPVSRTEKRASATPKEEHLPCQCVARAPARKCWPTPDEDDRE
jgi:hypothetical protein